MRADFVKSFSVQAPPRRGDVDSQLCRAAGESRYAAYRIEQLRGSGGRPFAPAFVADCPNIESLHRFAVYAARDASDRLFTPGGVEAAENHANQIRDAIRILAGALDKYDRIVGAGE